MTRKITSGPIRDKERTKLKLLNSVGNILKKNGFTALNASRIAKKSNVDRKLIYEYFGGVENLVKEYLNGRDYWGAHMERSEEIIEKSKCDFGKQTTYHLLEEQLDALTTNEEMRKIISWGVSESSDALKELNQKREILGELFFKEITDGYFKDKDKNIRPVVALLIGGIYYISLIAHTNDGLICGIDIRKEESQQEIKKTLKQIIEWAYS
jgi:AcrR family transcriptional regulator